MSNQEAKYRCAIRFWMNVGLDWNMEAPERYARKKSAKEESDAIAAGHTPEETGRWWEEETKAIRERWEENHE